MKNYLDITLLPDADIALYFLWEKVYQQLHLALVETQGTNKQVKIGVSFPEYNRERFHLGSKLRLFAPSSDDLEAININQWLSRLTDYVHITSIRDVPETKVEGYAHFKRLQLKSNNERLARRRVKRKKVREEEANIYYKDRKEVYSRAPFIRIKSLSSDKQYRLLIDFEKAETLQTAKGFSTYGLSSKSTVPIF